MTVLLAKSWDAETDPTGWWMSEKLDGIRARWTGHRFESRGGNVFAAPDWFRAKMPMLPLDGELWMGRGEFQRATSVVRSGVDKGWKDVVYVVFDIPVVEPGLTFEKRVAALKALMAGEMPTEPAPPAWLRAIDQARCESRAHLEQTVDAIVKAGGEGVMLRKPGSLYEPKRSSTLLKVKRFHDDEAVVTGYQAGKGKHAGVMGALDCRLANGTTFQIGTGFSDAERAKPPAIGAKVTFRYQELTKTGTPRFPSFVTVRDYE